MAIFTYKAYTGYYDPLSSHCILVKEDVARQCPAWRQAEWLSIPPGHSPTVSYTPIAIPGHH